jgi:hypothetical protein
MMPMAMRRKPQGPKIDLERLENRDRTAHAR